MIWKGLKIALKFGFKLPIYLYLLVLNYFRKKENHQFIRNIAKIVRKHCGYEVEVFGEIPTGHFFICCNHRGYFDPVLIMSYMVENLGFAMKKSLDKGIWRTLAYCTGSCFLWRTPKEDIQTIKKMCDDSINGKNWCVFPEGTRNTNDEMLNFSAGIFKIPLISKCDIVPVIVTNTEQVFELSGNKVIKIKFLEPVKYEEYKSMNTITLSKYIYKMMQKEYDILTKD